MNGQPRRGRRAATQDEHHINESALENNVTDESTCPWNLDDEVMWCTPRGLAVSPM